MYTCPSLSRMCLGVNPCASCVCSLCTCPCVHVYEASFLCSPFSVKPTSASLASNTCMQVDIEFLPQTVGEHSGTLEIHHDTGEGIVIGFFLCGFVAAKLVSPGEVLYVQLRGSANDVNVRLDRNSIMHENTYIGLLSKRFEHGCAVFLRMLNWLQLHYVPLQISDHSEQKWCHCAFCVESIW